MNKNTIVAVLIGLVIGVGGTLGVSALKDDGGTKTANTQQVSSTDHSAMSMDDMNKQLEGLSGDEFDKAFTEMMIAHHEGAVDMAEIELRYGTDEEMRQLAQEIIEAQQPEIKQMKAWLADHPDSAEPIANTKVMQQAYADGMDAMNDNMMSSIADPRPDMAFARGMLMHHIGAINMAKVQLKYGKNEKMRKLAQEIIDAQQSEIEQMQSWIKANKG